MDVVVYPNPFSGEIRFSFSKTTVIDKIMLTDALGKVVAHGKENIISTANIPAGMYFLIVRMGNGMLITRKVVKER